MRRVLGIEEVYRSPQLEDIPAKCGQYFKCVEAIVGSNDYKKAREKLNNKLKSKCGKCKNLYIKLMSRVLRIFAKIVL